MNFRRNRRGLDFGGAERRRAQFRSADRRADGHRDRWHFHFRNPPVTGGTLTGGTSTDGSSSVDAEGREERARATCPVAISEMASTPATAHATARSRSHVRLRVDPALAASEGLPPGPLAHTPKRGQDPSARIRQSASSSEGRISNAPSSPAISKIRSTLRFVQTIGITLTSRMRR